MHRRLIAAAIVIAGLTTAGVAHAENQPADPSVPAAGAGGKPDRPVGGPKAGMLKGAIHGDLLVRNEDGSTRTVTFDRGRITAIDAGSISIERPDGVSVSKTITDQTAFNGTPRDKLATGMGVIVVSEGGTASRVVSKGALMRPRKEARKDRAAEACANAPGAEAPDGVRARVKERLCQRLENRSAVADDGLETILS